MRTKQGYYVEVITAPFADEESHGDLETIGESFDRLKDALTFARQEDSKAWDVRMYDYYGEVRGEDDFYPDRTFPDLGDEEIEWREIVSPVT